MSAENEKRRDDALAAAKELEAALGAWDSSNEKAQRQKAVIAARKVLAAVQEPSGQGMEAFGQLCLITANRIFWEWGVFDVIPQSSTISYAELAAKVDADVSLLTRIGGVLVSSGVLEQTGTDKIAHTAKSRIFTGDDPAGFTYMMAWDNGVGSYATLPQYFQKYGRKEPQTQNHVPVTFGNGTPELTYYEILREDHRRRATFMKAMLPLEESMPLSGIYDFSWLVARAEAEPDSDRTLFIDVGGGKGQAIKAIHKEFPGLPLNRCLLQDLPEVVATIEAIDDPELREVKKMAIDFHREQPVKGALVYWIRRCLHNYSDAVCVNILKHVAGALAEDSKILLNEDILDNPPNPLAAVTDMIMMNFGGKQRNLECWERVASDAGLKIMDVLRVKGSSMGVLECVKI